MKESLSQFYSCTGTSIAFFYLPVGSNWQRRINPTNKRMDTRFIHRKKR